MWLIIASVILVALYIVWRYLTSSYNYWESKGVKSVPNPHVLVGSMFPVMIQKEHMLTFFKRLYDEFDGEPFAGYYQGLTPSLLIRDPELIKQVTVKDFNHFTDHGFKVHEEADPLEAKNLFNLEGQKWKDMRAKLTPTFTSGRMKAMFPLMQECASNLETFLTKFAETGESVEMKETVSLFTTDVISSCAFGIKINSFTDPDNYFRIMGRKLVKMDVIRSLKAFTMIFLPKIGQALRLSFIDPELTNYFRKMVKDVMDMRANTGETRKDFMQLLIELKEKGEIADDEEESGPVLNPEEWTTSKNLKLSHDDITAQATVFFFAGFETSSTLMSFALLELAANPDTLKQAQQEIDDVLQRHDGKITYQSVQEMHYLDAVMNETMRKYPPAANIMRICTKNYVIPGTEVTIEEGTPLMIATHAVQNDPKHFPDPDRFDPDRFTNDQKHDYKFLPFGVGPRQCIGNRFALLQSKLGLLIIIRKFELKISPETSYPVELDPKQFVITNKGGTWLKVALRAEE